MFSSWQVKRDYTTIRLFTIDLKLRTELSYVIVMLMACGGTFGRGEKIIATSVSRHAPVLAAAKALAPKLDGEGAAAPGLRPEEDEAEAEGYEAEGEEPLVDACRGHRVSRSTRAFALTLPRSSNANGVSRVSFCTRVPAGTTRA